ncbi:LysE family translocator [Alkalicoccus urumqiensis]|uniref:Lysine transporter LysE n=1 Tax=Alkalicoccus urumqiensis TaxID=1548213 RepID=A0A2P6MLF7_ALKUR|nr:LysE family transporter [Alkalicoccus urumqiensis]PRO67103.1 lysine transporter LysE [Alkalicoccus urumqiensis]
MLYVSWFLLGLALAAPVGPVTIVQISRGLQGGFRAAWLVGVGGMGADLLMMLLVAAGFSRLPDIWWIEPILWAAGGIVLFYLGIDSIRTGRRQLPELSGAETARAGSSLRTGFLLAAANPMNLVFWAGIYGSVLVSIEDRGSAAAAAATACIFLGIIVWDLASAAVIAYSRRFITPRRMQYISISAGLILLGFALAFFWAIFQGFY